MFPDLPGCFSAGDTLDEALDAAKEAAAGWVDTALDRGMEIPAASSLDDIRHLPEYEGWTIGVVELDPALFDDNSPGRVWIKMEWLGRQDSNLRMPIPKTGALPLGHAPCAGRKARTVIRMLPLRNTGFKRGSQSPTRAASAPKGVASTHQPGCSRETAAAASPAVFSSA